MIKIRDIENAISSMPAKKLNIFRAWFEKFDPAYRLGRQILEAERQIQDGETTPWSEIKRKHGL